MIMIIRPAGSGLPLCVVRALPSTRGLANRNTHPSYHICSAPSRILTKDGNLAHDADDSRGGGLGVVPVFAGAWLGHDCINGNLETDAGCDTRHSAFVDSALLPQAPGLHSVSVVKGLGHASLTVHAGRRTMA
jgi:hypothetical protein